MIIEINSFDFEYISGLASVWIIIPIEVMLFLEITIIMEREFMCELGAFLR